MATRICPEDVVSLVADPAAIGIVCCVGEDEENRNSAPTAHVYWMREYDNDKMELITDLRVLDRTLLHGDTVIHDRKKGVVTSTRIHVDIRFSDGMLINDVDTRDMRHLQPMRQGNWVVSEGWLGRVLNCKEDIVVRFDDGASCLVSSNSSSDLVPVQKMYERSPFFPSMMVKANNPDTFKNSQWIFGSYERQTKGVIVSIKPSEVLVVWITALQGASSLPPRVNCAPDQLQVLNHFGNTWWRLGDRGSYPRDEGVPFDDISNCCEVIATRTEVDIKYMDGTSASSVSAVDTHMFNPGPHEFYPGDLLCEKDNSAPVSRSNLYVVISADERSRMALVRKVLDEGQVAEPTDANKNDYEVMSAFDLQAHQDFSFRMGDVVVRLETGACTDGGKPSGNEEESTSKGMKEEDENSASEKPAGNVAAHENGSLEGGDVQGIPTATRLDTEERTCAWESAAGGSCDHQAGDAEQNSGEKEERAWNGSVGEVVDIEPNGKILVAWLGGEISVVHPEKIYRVAIEEEMEEAMFFLQDQNANKPSNNEEQSTNVVVSTGRVEQEPEKSVARVVFPTVTTFGTAIMSLPVVGSLLKSTLSTARMIFSQLFRFFFVPFGNFLPQITTGFFASNSLLTDIRPKGEGARDVTAVVNITNGAYDPIVNNGDAEAAAAVGKFEGINHNSEFMSATSELSKFDDVGARKEQGCTEVTKIEEEVNGLGTEAAVQLLLDASMSLQEEKKQEAGEAEAKCCEEIQFEKVHIVESEK
ncbi:hypothetical protein GUITHDRAFT_122599, partial [Guillardia theta CCMP2712]